MDHLPHGEKIIDIDKNAQFKGKQIGKPSVLNEKRLKAHENNMQRHPMYGKHLKRFYGIKSAGSTVV